MRAEAPRAKRAARVAVCGGSAPDGDTEILAEQVGEALGRAGAVLICGGLGGVMEAAARGACREGGVTVGVLPDADVARANPWISLPLPTGMGEMRNALVVRFADAVIAIGGEWGTLSEIALARRMNIPVVLLAPTLAATLGLEIAGTPAAAVERALSHAS